MTKKKTVTYKTKDKGKITGVKIQDKKVGNKTVSKVLFGEKAGPKGFRRKAKVVDKITPAGKRSTALYASKKTLKNAGADATGKNLRKIMKDIKSGADSVTIGKKTYKTKNKKANPNLKNKTNYGY